jgi:hypothetical protein
MRLHREALGDHVASGWYVLVTLGGFHLLDSLVSCDFIKAHEKIVQCSGGGFMREIVLTLRGSQRATLVERVIELPSLLG